MRFETTVEPREEDGTEVWDAVCNDTAVGVECFRSVGWATEESAQGRIDEHLAEHATQEVGRELEAYRRGISQEEYEVIVAAHEAANQLPTKEVE